MLNSLRFLTPALACAATLTASAASAEGYRILDMQRVLDETKAAKAVSAELDASGEKYKKYIAGKEEELRGRYKSLEENRSLLSPKDFEEKKNAFNKDLGAIQEQIQSKRKELGGARNEALVQINKATIDIVAGMAERDKFDIALLRSQTLFYDKKLDITDAVIQELDKRLPKITVKLK